MVDGPLFSEGPGSPRKPHDGESAGCLWVQKSKLLVIEVKTISCHYSRWAPAHQPMDPAGGPWAQESSNRRYGLGQKPPDRLLRRTWVPRVLQEATNWGTGHPPEIRPREQEKRKAASQEREAKETERKRRKGGGGRSWSPPGLCRPEARSPPGRGARGGGGPRPEPGNAPRAAQPKARRVPWLPDHLGPAGRPPRPASQSLREPGSSARAGPRLGRPSGPPSYEAHLLLRGAAGPVPRRRWDRPPPYVAPPSYDGPHRTLGARRPPQLAQLPAPLAPTPAPGGKDGEERPRKRLDPRIYRDVLGAWGIRQGRGALPGCGGTGAAPGGKASHRVPGHAAAALDRGGRGSHPRLGAGRPSGAPRAPPGTELPLRGPSGGERAGEENCPRPARGSPPGQRPPPSSRTLPRPRAPREQGSPGEGGGGPGPATLPTARKESPRGHTVPRSPRGAAGDDGVFVIDATCVAIRAQFIPAPPGRRVRLSPAPGPRERGGSPAGPPGAEGAEGPPRSGRLAQPPPKGRPEAGAPPAASPGERASRILGLPIPEPDLPAAPGPRRPDQAPEPGPAATGRRPAARGWARDPGPYAGALREAVSRIRRHTAPDSDSDEAPECGAPSCCSSSEGSDAEASGASRRPEQSPPGSRDAPGARGGRGESGRRAGELRDCIREILDVICQTEEALVRAEGEHGGGHPQP